MGFIKREKKTAGMGCVFSRVFLGGSRHAFDKKGLSAGKRIVAFLLTLALLGTVLPPQSVSAASRVVFHDVPQKAWYAGAIYALVEEGVVNGKSAVSFQPNGLVTRAEFLKMLSSAILTPEEIAEYKELVIFQDVSSGQWFAPYVNWGFQVGIAQGHTEELFAPGGFVTREEAAVFMARFAEAFPQMADLTEQEEEKLFSDAGSIAPWAEEGVSRCQRAGILSGYEDGSFRPKSETTRKEAAVLLCRLLDITPLEESQVPVPPPPDPEVQIREKISKLQKKFPHGAYWNLMGVGNHSGREAWEIVTKTPCNHWMYGSTYCNYYYGKSSVPVIGITESIQCLGFASMLSDQIFGKTAPVRVFYEFDELRIGDQIRLTDAEHSMVVTDKKGDQITVAEVNADYSTCRISWGRKLTRRELANYGGALYITRY